MYDIVQCILPTLSVLSCLETQVGHANISKSLITVAFVSCEPVYNVRT